MAALKSFRTPAAFRAWLARNHRSARELLLRCYKTRAARRGVTYAQALDEALCYGWIDGVRRGVDDVSFSVRFTPRRPRSTWSRVNVAHVQRLTREGRMAKPGLEAFKAREEARTGLYSFERAAMKLPPAYLKRLRADPAAWAHFQREAPWYRRTCTYFVMSAKREETRLRRLGLLIAYSRQGKRIPPLGGAQAAGR
jgi:uncharacterized protein YdeI (YjbR/CyaY-like superfamily)